MESHVKSTPNDLLIDLRNVFQFYERGLEKVPVLENSSLQIRQGESCAIVGKSGSGKTTLMNILGLLDRPTAGDYLLNGVSTQTMSPDELAHVRNHQIGFIFQSFNLIPRLNALDNVALPLFYRGVAKQQSRMIALEQLKSVGLEDRALHRPAELSGGQRQRVAIARALVTAPSLILADEPTGNLDDEAAEDILSLLLELNVRSNVALVIVTHSSSIANRCERQIEVANGCLQEKVGVL
jgi:putative ABC transport system ATP-binding protein